MTTLLLIRHGENDLVGKRLAGRMPGVHLNERGRQQADRLAQALWRAPLKAIYSSPLERAVETAEPLAKQAGLEILRRDGLIEIDFGKWQGITGKQMRRAKLWKVVQHSPSQMVFPGGESFVAAQQRISAELSAIAAQHQPHDLVACFSHSDAIKLAVAAFLGMSLDHFQRLSIDTASISVMYLHEGSAVFGPINMPVSMRALIDLSPMFPPPPPQEDKKS